MNEFHTIASCRDQWWRAQCFVVAAKLRFQESTKFDEHLGSPACHRPKQYRLPAEYHVSIAHIVCSHSLNCLCDNSRAKRCKVVPVAAVLIADGPKSTNQTNSGKAPREAENNATFLLTLDDGDFCASQSDPTMMISSRTGDGVCCARLAPAPAPALLG